MESKKVGLLIPFYENDADYTTELFHSIILQTYDNIAIYWLDDSADEFEYRKIHYTIDDSIIIKNFFEITRNISLCNQVSLGTFRSYNILAFYADIDGCDYIIPIGQDDTLEPTCIEETVKYLEAGDYDCVDLPIQNFGADTNVQYPQPQRSFEDSITQNPYTSFMLFKMNVWRELGGYDVSITPRDIKVGYEDWDLNLRLMKGGYKIGVLDKVLYNYRVHAKQAHRIASKNHKVLHKILRERHEKKD